MRLLVSFTQEKALSGLSLLFLKKIIRETLSLGLPDLEERRVGVRLAVASVSDEAIALLNTTYRSKPKPTDILSFGNFKHPAEILAQRERIIDLGQIVFSPDFIHRSAKEDGVSWKHELVFVLAHGILHLLGYDHSTEMFEIQDAVTESIMRSRRKRNSSAL